MIPKIKQALAISKGYSIDDSCYPNMAYKGPRFRPSEWFPVFTELEATLLDTVDLLNKELGSAGILVDVEIPGVYDAKTGILDASQDFGFGEA